MFRSIVISFFMILTGIVEAYSTNGGDRLFQTTFVLKKLPANTPHDATFYLACDVTGWQPNNAALIFKKDNDGLYKLTIPHEAQQIAFKVTRGNWDAVEGRANGRARPNRVFKKDSQEQLAVIELEVKSWEDLSHGSYYLY
ncbi:MAG: hypothetical protein AAFO69_21980, partial [Bacteroidota bacterium]